MKLIAEQIGYRDMLVEPYSKKTKSVATLEELRQFTSDWELLAWDAMDKVAELSEGDFKSYLKASAKEKRGRFAVLEALGQFGMIWMPETLFKISMIAHHYHVPDGCAFIRLRDMGQMTIEDGRAVILDSKSPKEK